MEKIKLDLSKLLGYRIIAGSEAVLSSPKIGVKGCNVQDGAAVLARQALLAAKVGVKTDVSIA